MKTGGTLQILAAGCVTIGIATAVLLPGRQTIGVTRSGGNAISHVASTVITGRD